MNVEIEYFRIGVVGVPICATLIKSLYFSLLTVPLLQVEQLACFHSREPLSAVTLVNQISQSRSKCFLYAKREGVTEQMSQKDNP